MHLSLRILLVIGAISILGFVLSKIRKNQLSPNDSVFWFIFSGCLVLVSAFPVILIALAGLLGVESPVNLVYLIIIGVVILRLLMMSVENARLKLKLNDLIQNVALERQQKNNHRHIDRR